MPPVAASALDTLRKLELFSGLTDDELAAIGALSRPRTCRAGERIVREGDHDRALFVILTGETRVVHADVHLGTLRAGEHFGDMALVTGAARTADVVADTDCELLVLDPEFLDALADTNARLALRLLRAIVQEANTRLARMNETLGALVKQRGLARRLDIRVRIGGASRTLRNGAMPVELLPERVGGAPVVAALVDGRARSLDVPLTGDCSLAPLTTAHWEGQRIFRRSLGLAVLEAGRRIGASLRIGPSLGVAQRVFVEEGPAPAELAPRLDEALRAIIARDVPLVRERLGVGEAIEYFGRVGWHDAARLADTTRGSGITLAAYGELFVPEVEAFLPRTGRLVFDGIVADGDSLLLVFSADNDERPGAADTPPEARPAPPARRDQALAIARRSAASTSQQHRWLRALGVRCVGDFNQSCITGEVGELIQVAEGFHEKGIGAIADALAERRDRVKVVCIAGPSSSGKTTFIRRLRVQLQINGLSPKGLGLDDYYVDRDRTPRDADGDFDFEAVDALRLDLLADHLAKLARGEAVRTAHFDFRGGKSHPEGGPLVRLGDGDLLMLEGIHGLNPRIYGHLPPEQVFRVFVCPQVQLPFDHLSQVHASDVRLLRRIVRDRHGRAQDAAETILRWPKVRDGERRHIHPFQSHADAIFDTSLVYEISVLKVFAERYLLEVPAQHEAQATAERLLAMLDRWVTIYPDHVPPTSILREFIGGSGFTY
jgi:uridine kinase